MFHDAKLLKSYWGEAILMTTYLQNWHLAKSINGQTLDIRFGMESCQISHTIHPS